MQSNVRVASVMSKSIEVCGMHSVSNPSGVYGGRGLGRKRFSVLYAFYLFLNLRCAIVGEKNKQYSATLLQLVFCTSHGLFQKKGQGQIHRKGHYIFILRALYFHTTRGSARYRWEVLACCDPTFDPREDWAWSNREIFQIIVLLNAQKFHFLNCHGG